MKSSFCIPLLAPLLLAGATRADDRLPPFLRDVRIDQCLNAQVPLDAVFRDESWRPVRLGDYFNQKPVILVLAYYRCPRLCTQVLNGVLDGLKGLPSFSIGDSFHVVAVSFDAREKPDLARAKRQSYVDGYGRPGADAGWHFLTGDQKAIDRLTQAVGFHYAYDPQSDQFAHASGIMVLTPQGKVARYFYGIKYAPTDLRLGLVEASENKIGSPVDQVLLFCFHYDPATGKYTPAVMNLVRLSGAVTLLALGTFFFLQWRAKKVSGTFSAGHEP